MINDISISGNLKTPEHIILNQIKHPLNSEFNDTIAREDQIRIYNLDIFSYVQIGYNGSSYTVIVQEKKDVSFQPLFKKIDGIGWSYGTKILFNNIKGSTNKLGLSLGIGKINLGKIKYIYKPPSNNRSKLSISYNIDENQDIDDEYHMSKQITAVTYQKKFEYFSLDIVLQNQLYKLKLNDNTNNNYSYISQSLKYKRIRNSKLISSKLAVDFNNYVSSNVYDDFQSLSFNHQYINTFNEKHNSPTINVRTKIHLASNATIPIFEKKYLGGDDFVRGYKPKTFLNDTQVIDKLKFDNYIFTSIQFEIPWFKKNTFKTNIIFFADQALGSNQYNSYDINNRIIGYGFGYNVLTNDNMQFDIHFGLNKYHNQVIHFMVKRNV